MGMPVRHYYTAADLLDLPDDGNKYEVVHGELLVSPSPRLLHQRIVGRLLRLVGAYVDTHRLGEAYPGGDVQSGTDSLVIPDLLVLNLESAREARWVAGVIPLLVVEVLSPSSLRHDRFTKRRLYQELGVPLYWLVDPDARSVEVWTPEATFPVTEHEAVRWQPDGANEPLVLSLNDLFRAP